MKLLDPLYHLFTYGTRARYSLIITTRQNGNALALMMVARRGRISYEVYNSLHVSREPVPMDGYQQALRYMFPRSIEAAQTLENRRLRDQAVKNVQGVRRELRGKPPAPPARDLDEDAKTAIIALGGVGTDRAAALAMEIHVGMERRRRNHQ
jgi:hypothetical protein